MTVTGGAGANTIRGSGSGADILNGGDGSDIFMYASMAPLLSANSVFDRISGDNGIDTVEIARHHPDDIYGPDAHHNR